jgi:glycosyltransferase involved in cell wall biosynthesis
MKISIITPMFNSENYIGRMICALKSLNYPQDKLEFIFIDNGSADQTMKIVESESITSIVMPNATISSMRNYGARKASGEILGFIDSDCLVEPDWALQAIESISKDNKVGIVGGYYGLGDSPNWVEQTWHDFKKNIVGNVSFVSAGNMVVRRDVFLQINGFDEKLETGEDWDICQRMIKAGYKILNNPELKVKHLGNVKTLSNIIRKERWYGKGMFDVLKGRYVTKPIVASLVFIFCFFLLGLSIITGNLKFTSIAMIILLALVFSMAIFFTKNIRNKRLACFLKALPISFCYVLGRSLSIFDITRGFVFKKFKR